MQQLYNVQRMQHELIKFYTRLSTHADTTLALEPRAWLAEWGVSTVWRPPVGLDDGPPGPPTDDECRGVTLALRYLGRFVLDAPYSSKLTNAQARERPTRAAPQLTLATPRGPVRVPPAPARCSTCPTRRRSSSSGC